jgi:hypothetical protein
MKVFTKIHRKSPETAKNDENIHRLSEIIDKEDEKIHHLNGESGRNR